MLTIKLKSRQKENKQSSKNGIPLNLIFCFPWMCILATCTSCQPNGTKQSSAISTNKHFKYIDFTKHWNLVDYFHLGEEMHIQIHQDR